MQTIDASRARVWAAGSLRTAAVGTSFTLLDHRAYTGLDSSRDTIAVLAVSHVARSNLSADLTDGGAEQIVVNPAHLKRERASQRKFTGWMDGSADIEVNLVGVPSPNSWRQ
jgi:uncharacterized protein involved in type VI secretion and phage assembly